MFSIPSRLGLVAAFALAAIAATPGTAAAWEPTVLDCKNLVPWFQSNNYSWWWGALGNCKVGKDGPTSFFDIFTCAWNQVQQKHRLDCVKSDLWGAANTAAGVDIVAAYNGRPTCSWLTNNYSRNVHVWERAINATRLGPGVGPTTADAVFERAFESLPEPHQQECLKILFQSLPQTATMISGPAGAVAYNTPGSCATLVSAYQQNNFDAWWHALGAQKTGSTGATTREEIVDRAFASLPAGHQEPCLKTYLSNAAVTDLGVYEVRVFNGITDGLSANTFTEPSVAPEQCSVPGADAYLQPTIPYTFLERQTQFVPPDYNVPFGQHLGSDEGRLRSDFREIARTADPMRCALPHAALAFARWEQSLTDDLKFTATAYADLAVTGTKAFGIFQGWRPANDYCNRIETMPPVAGCPEFPESPGVEEWRAGCRLALDRAYRVANFLRSGQAIRAAGQRFDKDGNLTPDAALDLKRKTDERAALGWIAVSGEDDAPHRPVNVPSSDYPQYNIRVGVETPLYNVGREQKLEPLVKQSVQARYTIAQAIAPAPTGPVFDPKVDRWYLAPDPVPSIAPGSEVILFVHGMDSRAEEATDITKALFVRLNENEQHAPRKNLVIITVDLPSSGYTQSLDYNSISLLAAIGSPFSNADFAATGLTPMLDFLETFLVRFVETLPPNLAVKETMKAVMGGSLGGNLTFRLGRRKDTSWIKNVVTWSPASIWNSMGEGNSLAVHAAPRRTWFNANDRNSSDPNDLTPARLGRRKDFFVRGWDEPAAGIVVPLSQPETWTATSYRCRDAAIAASRLDRQETYNPLFLSWRWRLAAEQLLYSHQTFELETGQRRYIRNDKRMFLSCGVLDAVPFNHICPSTQTTAPHMKLTPGMARYLPDTGHSVDAERPTYFARKMDEFLGLR